MHKQLLLLIALALVVGSPTAKAQGSGKPFGARDPRTCASRKQPTRGGPSADQAKQYVTCDAEHVIGANDDAVLYLATDVKVEVAKGRPFNIVSDSFGFATDNQIDPSEQVYPIRGSYVEWRCNKVGAINGTAGKNCIQQPKPRATGLCFKSSFGDWHCSCNVLSSLSEWQNKYPPPTGQ